MASNDAADTLAGLDETTKTLSERLSEMDGLSKSVGSSLNTAFKGAVVQGKALDVVLRSVAERLSSKALDAALSPLTDGIGTGLSKMAGSLVAALGFSHGGVFSAGRVTPFADGGVVSTPTYFPMRGGAGLMGEAGAEAIMPLARGPDGRLGIAAQNTAGTTHVTFNVTTPDAASFRRSEAQMTSMLARAVGRGRRGL